MCTSAMDDEKTIVVEITYQEVMHLPIMEDINDYITRRLRAAGIPIDDVGTGRAKGTLTSIDVVGGKKYIWTCPLRHLQRGTW